MKLRLEIPFIVSLISYFCGITLFHLTSCASKPDPASLFPIQTESADYQDGFRAGFYEGLTYNQITP